MKNPKNLDKSTRASAIRDIMAPRVQRSNRILETGFRRVPSVVNFTIYPSQVNTLLEGTGLDRNLPTKTMREIHESNNKHNDYMERQLAYLKRLLAKGDTYTYWSRCYWLMRNSQSFRLSAFNTVLKGWYKELSKKRIYQILFGIEYILKNKKTDLKYFRVHIPKGDPQEIIDFLSKYPGKAWPGKMRPLGVPTAPWRVVLHMWNNFLVMFLEDEIKKYNHAYLPGSGTNSALKHFVTDVIKAKYVYEFDFKGFFNNVSITDTIFSLEVRGMPDDVSGKLEKILKRVPANLGLYDEHTSEYDRSLAIRGYLEGQFDEPEPDIADLDAWVQWNIRKKRHFTYAKIIRPLPGKYFNKGLPQGAAPSTILSLLSLSHWHSELEEKGIKLLMYADDGFLYSDSPFEPFAPQNLEFEKSKSRWVIRDGNNQTPKVKFLGLLYTFATDLLRGQTRNGSTLEFGPKQLEVLKFVQETKTYGSLMEALVSSGLWGLTLSKLYGGKWGAQDWTPKARYLENSFWGSTFNIKFLSRDKALQRVASTISCEWLSQAIMRTKAPKLSLKALKREETLWRNSQRIQINLKDLQEALRYDMLWAEKRAIILNPDSILKPFAGSYDPGNKLQQKLLKKAIASV